MTDFQKYISALRKCAKEHENDKTPAFNIRVSDLCRDTARLLEELEQEPNKCCKEPIISHSEISGLIYVYFGDQKFEITEYAIEAVKAIAEQEPKKSMVSVTRTIQRK